jgi:hypothetical protein
VRVETIDAPDLERIGAVGREAKELFLAATSADVADPPGTHRNMVFRHLRIVDDVKQATESAGRTRVIFGLDRVTVFVFADSSLETLVIPRAALRDAQFELRQTGAPEGAKVGGCELVVTTKQPFAIRRIDFPDPFTGRLQNVTPTQVASFDCDSDTHARELRVDLERFAAGSGR